MLDTELTWAAPLSTFTRPSTVFVRTLADAIQRVHEGCKKKTKKQLNKQTNKQTCGRFSDHFICDMSALSVLFFFIIERSVCIVLVLYYQKMLEKVSMIDAKVQQISRFFVTEKPEKTHVNAAHA